MTERKKLLFWLVVLMFLIFGVNSLALRFDWYYYFSWLDIPMHYLGGLWVALFYLYFTSYILERRPSLTPTLLFVILVGVLWEIFEYWTYNYIGGAPFDRDTLVDLTMDLLGGATGMLLLKR